MFKSLLAWFKSKEDLIRENKGLRTDNLHLTLALQRGWPVIHSQRHILSESLVKEYGEAMRIHIKDFKGVL